jgi:poly(A) polymerase
VAKLDPHQLTQLLTPAVLRIMQALQQDGGEARLVGGAVRDAVIGRKIGDLDLAANLPPQRVTEILVARGLKCVPTGIAHGTITAVVDHAGYEITSLRRDVETDGRHAQVEYTDDWQTDAARRDFTMNALYLDAQGTIYDYFDGLHDAHAGRVRFIGVADARIEEDVLRILRFFRFHAWFGQGEIDQTGLAACARHAASLPRLSAERVAREVLKLLAAPVPADAWRLMIDHKIIQHWLAEATDTPRLQLMQMAENANHDRMPGIARLAALLPEDETVAQGVAARLKLSKRDGELLAALAALPGLLHGHLDPVPLRRLLYARGVDNVRSALYLTGEKIEDALTTVAAWQNPVFPIKGEDLARLGIPAGPQMGEILKKIEAWWIASDFHPGREACLSQARDLKK